MQIAALIISIVALLVSSGTGVRALRLSRQSTSTRVLIDLFSEHRSDRLAKARNFVHTELGNYDPTIGLRALAEDDRVLVRELAAFYDNLGVLVAYDVVDLAPVSGYLGGSVLDLWPKLQPFVVTERERRTAAGNADPQRWVGYFEILHGLIQDHPPASARQLRRRRRLLR